MIRSGDSILTLVTYSIIFTISFPFSSKSSCIPRYLCHLPLVWGSLPYSASRQERNFLSLPYCDERFSDHRRSRSPSTGFLQRFYSLHMCHMDSYRNCRNSDYLISSSVRVVHSSNTRTVLYSAARTAFFTLATFPFSFRNTR